MVQQLHRLIYALAYGVAIIGGIVLSALILMICASIMGRTGATLLHSDLIGGAFPDTAARLLGLGIGAVKGDYELLESGMAFAVFAFLGLCQITSGHATVDVLTDRLPDRARRLLQMGIEIAFAAALVLIAVQLHDGLQTQMRRGSVTFLLQYPVWWSYAAAFVPAVFAAAVAVWMALVRTAEGLLGRPLIDPATGAHL
ncbi:TRAP transporter small permease [Roseicitreum antarcticum]|uniref:TRAP transporter small permease protein n=1 Tax=Roseicitreum antarcticum TaxID=564137 RepID=A0A1H2QRL7_9RHOB|nr:TRAP transporter small permease subunit [Roseicitreum antarcticum]SDW09089.1 TRAP-type C4-dicarboxylate transport system, small permease component [Roseicitreum antarcticum]